MEYLRDKRKHVLVVDDNTDNIKVIGSILSENGYDVSVAKSGKQALEVIVDNIPDLILLDISMPEMDGFETCVQLKKLPDIHEIPIIFLTANIDIEHKTKAFSIGAVDYITKPFNKEEILIRVKNHVTLFKAKKNIQAALEREKVQRKSLAEINEELKRHRHNLEKLVAKRTESLEKTNENLIAEMHERKQAQLELENTKDYLDNIFHSLNCMLISVSAEGRIKQCNTAFEKFTDFSMKNASDAFLLEQIPFFNDYKDQINEAIATAKPLNITKTSININGSKKYLDMSINPLISHGKAEGTVILVDDITDLVLKDEQLLQAQKMEAVGNLAGGLAHDFNNALAGIKGPLSIIKHLFNNKELDLNKIAPLLEMAEESTSRSADIVKQLLTLSRRHEAVFIPVNLNSSIKRVMAICLNSFDKSIELEVTFFDDEAMISADPTQIEQAILNLCINGMHAMTIMRHDDDKQEQNKLAINIKKITADRHFCKEHLEAREGAYWIVAISDTGIGMNSKTIAKIFDPFFTTKSSETGTGLGLAMVYNIIRQYKGFIDVYSEPGAGTRFNVFIPVLEGNKTLETADHSCKIAKGSGSILVVDDEKVVREMAQIILEECGYEVFLASNGLEGIEIFKEKHQDIDGVILDMAMPKMSGKETYVEMKRIDPSLKCLLTSGFKMDGRVQDTMKLGVNDFIQKPFSLAEMANKVKKLLQK